MKSVYISFFGEVELHRNSAGLSEKFRNHNLLWDYDYESGITSPNWDWLAKNATKLSEESFGAWRVDIYHIPGTPSDAALLLSGNAGDETGGDDWVKWPLNPVGQGPSVPVNTGIGPY